MPVRLIDTAPMVAEMTRDQRHMYAGLRAGGLVVPRLVSITTNGGMKPIRSYQTRLRHQARAVAPGGTMYHPIVAHNEYQALDEVLRHADQPGVGILMLRPFADEALAASIGLLEAVPPEQDVDGQHSSKHFGACTARACIKTAEHAAGGEGGLKGKQVVIVGAGPAVGAPAIEMLANMPDEERPGTVTVITREVNQDKMGHLGDYDVVIGAAGGCKALEIITPDCIRRSPDDTRPPLIIVDAAYDRAPDGTNQGNVHRSLTDGSLAEDPTINCRVTELGQIGALTGCLLIENTLAVPQAQGLWTPAELAA